MDPDHYAAPKSSWYAIPERVVTVVSASNALCGGLTESDGFVITYGLQQRVLASFVSNSYKLADSVKLQFETELVEKDSNVLAWDGIDDTFKVDEPSIGEYNYLQYGFLCSNVIDTFSYGILQVSLSCNNYENALDSITIRQGGVSLWSHQMYGLSSFQGEVQLQPDSSELELVFYADTTVIEPLAINHLYPSSVDVTITEVAPRESVEWLEIYNGGERVLSLEGWGIRIGDDTIALEDGSLNSGEYLVLSSFNEFADYNYLHVNKRITMSNYSDTLSLLAPWGVVDSLSWDYKEFEHWDIETLNRGANALFLCNASPGEETECVEEGALELSIHPKIFSPDGDGTDEQVYIGMGSAYGVEYELTLWALSGDLLYTHHSTELDTFLWNGIDHHGHAVPRGPVLVHLRAGDREMRGELILWR